MRALSAISVVFWLLLAVNSASAQDYLTKQAAILIPADSPKLSTSGKDALSASVTAKAPKNSLNLTTDTRVRLVRRSRFLQRETIYDRENSKATSINRLFKVAFVEVVTGEKKGEKGWVVISYRDTGSDPQVFLAQAPPLESAPEVPVKEE